MRFFDLRFDHLKLFSLPSPQELKLLRENFDIVETLLCVEGWLPSRIITR